MAIVKTAISIQESLFERADAALRRSKDTGKDRATAASE